MIFLPYKSTKCRQISKYIIHGSYGFWVRISKTKTFKTTKLKGCLANINGLERSCSSSTTVSQSATEAPVTWISWIAGCDGTSQIRFRKCRRCVCPNNVVCYMTNTLKIHVPLLRTNISLPAGTFESIFTAFSLLLGYVKLSSISRESWVSIPVISNLTGNFSPKHSLELNAP